MFPATPHAGRACQKDCVVRKRSVTNESMNWTPSASQILGMGTRRRTLGSGFSRVVTVPPIILAGAITHAPASPPGADPRTVV